MLLKNHESLSHPRANRYISSGLKGLKSTHDIIFAIFSPSLVRSSFPFAIMNPLHSSRHAPVKPHHAWIVGRGSISGRSVRPARVRSDARVRKEILASKTPWKRIISTLL